MTLQIRPPQYPNLYTKLCSFVISKFLIKDCLLFYSACACGKAQRLPSPPSPNVYTKPLDLLYSDLWGPAPISSRNRNLYYLSIMDAFSRYTWIFPIKKKSKALEVFTQFKLLIENQLGSTIKTRQTDWEEEFRAFQSFLQTNGMLHRVTCPRTNT